MGESNEDAATEPTIDHDVVLVGCGKMGAALVGGLVDSGRLAADQLACVDVHDSTAQDLAEALGAHLEVGRLKSGARIWVFAVKPRDLGVALESRRDDITGDDLVISVAAGVSTKQARTHMRSGPALVRAMPNTPALVGEGVTGIYSPDGRGIDVAGRLFRAVGTVVELHHESDFDALTAISGSGPAYVFTALEALADGGVLQGLSREVARTLAVATVRGAAALAQQSDAHTAELKDRVASPAGTTIAGLAALEARGFRDALINAVCAAAERSREMSDR